MMRKGQNLLELLVRREAKTAEAEVARTVRSCTLSELFVKRAQVRLPQPKTPTLPEPSMAPAKMVTPKLRNADYGYNPRGYTGVDDPAGYTGPVKTGPLLARDVQNPFQAGVDRMLKEKARGPAPLTNQDYAQRFKRESDALTDAQRQAQEQAYWKKQPINQRLSDADIAKQTENYRGAGDSLYGRLRGLFGEDSSVPEYLHDSANWMEIGANGLQKGLDWTINRGMKYLDPRRYIGGKTSREALTRSYDNDWANASRIYDARHDKLMNDMMMADANDSRVQMMGGAMRGLGEFAGGTIATAGVGGAASMGAKGILSAGMKAAPRIGRVASFVTKPLGSRASNWAGRTAVKYTAGATRAAAMPLRTVGAVTNPTRSLNRGANRVGAAWNSTAKPWLQATGDLGKSMVGRGQFMPAAKTFAGRTWNVMSKGFDKTMVPGAYYGAVSDVYNGNPGGAAGGVGSAIAFGAGALPGIGLEAYRAFTAPDDAGDYPEDAE